MTPMTCFVCGGQPGPCRAEHRRCRLCGWLLYDGEASGDDDRLCRYCEEAR